MSEDMPAPPLRATDPADWRGRGRKPVDRDLALLNRDIYQEHASGIEGWTPLFAMQLERLGVSAGLLDDPGSGFHARIYTHAEHGHALVLRGTDEARDWISNLRQAFGADDEQFRRSVLVALQAKTVFGDSLVLTGHSLGGGLASLASLRAGVPAVTFNASGLHDRTLERHGIPADVRPFAAASGHIRRYTVENDIVTALHQEHWQTARLLPDPIGHRIQLRDPDPLGSIERLAPGSGLLQGLRAHSIDAVLGAFDAPAAVHARPEPGASLVAQSLQGLRSLQEVRGGVPLPTEQFLNLSMAMAVLAHGQGMRRIDHVVASEDGGRLFAIEGPAADPAQRRVAIDVASAACEPAGRSAAALRAPVADAEPPLHPRAGRQQLPHAPGDQAPAIILSTWPSP